MLSNPGTATACVPREQPVNQTRELRPLLDFTAGCTYKQWGVWTIYLSPLRHPANSSAVQTRHNLPRSRWILYASERGSQRPWPLGLGRPPGVVLVKSRSTFKCEVSTS